MAIRALVLGVAAIGGPLWWFSPAHEATADPIVTASVERGDRQAFTVSNIENRTACLIVRGESTTRRSSALHAEEDCASVWPRLTEARNWTESGEGTVVLTDGRGEQILTLGFGDGVAFEALEPSDAVLVLTAAN